VLPRFMVATTAVARRPVNRSRGVRRERQIRVYLPRPVERKKMWEHRRRFSVARRGLPRFVRAVARARLFVI